MLNRNSEGELKVESVIVQVAAFLPPTSSLSFATFKIGNLFSIKVEPSGEEGVKDVRVSWAYTDDYLGSTILQAIQGIQ